MLGQNGYSQDQIDNGRRLIADELAAYDRLASVATGKAAAAVDDLETRHFNSLVLVLDQLFVHRLRGQEGKDGNAMNEVRLLSRSLVENHGVLVEDKGIKLRPETSVLGLAVGDRIAVTRDGFGKLADAYFTAIEGSFLAT